MKTESFSLPKMPTKLIILNVCVFIMGHVYFWAEMLFNRILLISSIFDLMSSWHYALYLLVTIVIAFCINAYFVNKLAKYDGTDATYDSVASAAMLYPSVTRSVPLILMLFFVPVLNAAAVSKGVELPLFSMWLLVIGAWLLLALFMYAAWFRAYETWLKWLPITKKYVSMPYATRAVIVCLFGLIGVVCSCTGVMFLAQGNVTAVLNFQILPTVLAGITLAMLSFHLQAKDVSLRIYEIAKITTSVADNDFSIGALEILTRDDLGMVAKQLNLFVNSNRTLLGNIVNTEKQSEIIAQKLQKDISDSEIVISEIKDSVVNVKNDVINQSAGVEEAHSTVTQIQSRIERLNSQIESQATSVSQASAAVEQMVANIRSVTDILGKNTTTVDDLTKASELGQNKVEESVTVATKVMQESAGLIEATEVIQNIATQTNLLAMNAAIEAAHAGEAGKGFAVVADEIRKLAEDSNNQGQTISARLKEFEISIEAISKSTREVQSQFDTIFDLSNNVKDQEDVIKAAMDEQSAGSGQVLDAMRTINDITVSVRDSSVEMLSGSKEIVTEMDVLAEVTNKVNEAMIKIDNGVGSINVSIANTISVSKENKEGVANLGVEVCKFKL